MSLSVSEIFYSLQGEGKTIGMPCVFLRLAGCNLMCGGQGTQFDKELYNGATWRCDTIEVWMKGKQKTNREILEDYAFRNFFKHGRIIITGGEPLLQESAIAEFIPELYNFAYLSPSPVMAPIIEIETNGTIFPSSYLRGKVDQWNVSPKLSNSGNAKEVRINIEALKELNTLNTQFKFVVSKKEDLKEIFSYLQWIDINKVILMPAGESQKQLSETYPIVAELALQEGINFSPRLHIDIWNQKTGV